MHLSFISYLITQVHTTGHWTQNLTHSYSLNQNLAQSYTQPTGTGHGVSNRHIYWLILKLDSVVYPSVVTDFVSDGSTKQFVEVAWHTKNIES